MVDNNRINRWLERVENYIDDINNNKFPKEKIDELIKDISEGYILLNEGYSDNIRKKINEHLMELVESLENIKELLANYYRYKKEEIYIDASSLSKYYMSSDISYIDLFDENGYTPYKVIIGDMGIENQEIPEIKNLEVVLGNIRTEKAIIGSLGDIKYIAGTLKLDERSQLNSFGNLTYVGANLECSSGGLNTTSLENIETVGGSVYISKAHNLEDFGKLTSIGKDLGLGWELPKFKSLKSLKTIGGNLGTVYPINDIGALESIGGSIHCLEYEKETELMRESWINNVFDFLRNAVITDYNNETDFISTIVYVIVMGNKYKKNWDEMSDAEKLRFEFNKERYCREKEKFDVKFDQDIKAYLKDDFYNRSKEYFIEELDLAHHQYLILSKYSRSKNIDEMREKLKDTLDVTTNLNCMSIIFDCIFSRIYRLTENSDPLLKGDKNGLNANRLLLFITLGGGVLSKGIEADDYFEYHISDFRIEHDKYMKLIASIYKELSEEDHMAVGKAS